MVFVANSRQIVSELIESKHTQADVCRIRELLGVEKKKNHHTFCFRTIESMNIGKQLWFFFPFYSEIWHFWKGIY